MGRIRLHQLTRQYGRARALDGVDLQVEPERTTVFCGPPGSGKSVLFRLLVGLEAPDAGRILVDDADITDLSGDRRSIGYVPQSFALFPHMSVFDNIAYPMALQGVAKAEIVRRVERAQRARQSVARVDPLAPQLGGQPAPTMGQDAPAESIARLQHRHPMPGVRERERGRKPGQARPYHQHTHAALAWSPISAPLLAHPQLSRLRRVGHCFRGAAVGVVDVRASREIAGVV